MKRLPLIMWSDYKIFSTQNIFIYLNYYYYTNRRKNLYNLINTFKTELRQYFGYNYTFRNILIGKINTIDIIVSCFYIYSYLVFI